MQNPTAFDAKMMSDIMYYHQAKSRSGWIIFYAGCPISWASKLQSQVALSTTKSEYIAMSQALKDIIPIMGLIQKMRKQ
jgi:hypothetical protein